MTRNAKHPVRTLEKSLRLVEALKDRNGGQIYELAGELDLGESAIHNHLNTLREHGYVVKSDNEYRLSLKFLDIGGYTQTADDLYRAANPVVNELASKTGETVLLAVEEHEVGVFLLTQSISTRARGPEIHTGNRFELANEPVGLTILSELPEERMSEIFDRRGIDPEVVETVREEIEEVREEGHIIGRAPRRNRQCVSAPITTDDDRILGALGIEASTVQHDDSWFTTELLDAVSDGVGSIEKNLQSMFLRDAWIDSSTVRD